MGTGKYDRRLLAPAFNGVRPPTVIKIEPFDDELDHETTWEWLRRQRDSFNTWWYIRSPRHRLCLLVSCIALLLASIIGISVGITKAGSSGVSNPNVASAEVHPMVDPSSIDTITIMDDPNNREGNILGKLERLSTVASLQDQNSSQYAALRWIVDDDAMQLQSTSPFLSQRYAVAVLFFALDGPAWKIENPWIQNNSGTSECLWQGIECDQDKAIEHIFLNQIGLKGRLPKEIGALSHLKKLDLRDNLLSGDLPKDISDLNHLTLLLLEGNKDLGGSVPDNVCRTVEWVTADCDKVSCSCCANCNGDNVTIGTNGPILTGNVTAGRISLINQMLRDLSNDIVKAGSPQNQALNWMLYGDDRKLTVDDETLIQRYVLAVLYFSLDGKNWPFASSWLTEDSECGYSGVACNEFGFVTTIAMVDANLIGTLPPELGLLDDLEFFDLSDNKISGMIPIQLAELDYLQSILLHDNDLGGSVPPLVCNLREGDLKEFKTDCGGSNPKVFCDCCTNCGQTVVSRQNEDSVSGDDGSKLDYFVLYGSRGQKIAAVLEDLSRDVYKRDSSRGDATEWILKEDPMSLDHDDPSLLQRWILSLVYFQLDGANWIYKDYLNGNDECQWDGITCNEDNEVTKIVLTNGGLLGEIPYELGALDKLQVLDLSGNFIEGEAPEEFCIEEEDSGFALETLIFDCLDPPLVKCDCCTPCNQNPSEKLTNTTRTDNGSIDYMDMFGHRGQRIAQSLDDVTALIYSQGSTRAAAAEWLIKEDKMELEHSDPTLVQRFVLAVLYYQLDGANWVYSNFLTSAAECNWDGITCDDEGNVIGIELPNGGLMGDIPFELGALDFLSTLDLRGNRVEGEAPEELCDEKDDPSFALQSMIFDCMDPPLVDCDCCTPCDPPEKADIVPDDENPTSTSNTTSSNLPATRRVDYQAIAGHRGVRIAETLSKFTDSVNTAGSKVASATIWLVRDDKMGLEHDDEDLLQRWILAVLYFHTDGRNWDVSRGFLTVESECKWTGISCNDNGDVTSIVLADKGLLGAVPEELAMLDQLKTLDLRDNRLEGEVPEDLCFVDTIEVLVLDCNNPPLLNCDCCTTCEG